MKLVLILAVISAAVATATDSPCDGSCPEDYAPVCASDGVSYDNECFFEYVKCLTHNTTLSIQAAGTCDASSSSSSASGFGSTSGSGFDCAQEFACLDIYDPVCGSDGQSYSSDCVLALAHCADPSVTQTHTGACSNDSSSESGAEAGV